MFDTVIPDLTLQGLPLGPSQAPIDLRWLLYTGASSTHQRKIQRAIDAGQLGRPQFERLPLLEAIHRNWQAALTAKSMSAPTVYGLWGRLRAFVSFAESDKRPLTLAGAISLYLAYCQYIKRRADLKAGTQYAYSISLALIIATALGLDSAKLQWKTKILPPRRLGNQAAKENLQNTATFVQTLLETVEQLSVNVIRGHLPVTLRYANYGEHALHCGRSLQPVERLKGAGDANKRERALKARERRANDTSVRARSQLVNLRIDAELLIFVSQTGCNLTQALQLTGSQFRYQSVGDYLHLIAWKNRAKHAVDLRIHKGYRTHFEVYLKWREALFPEDLDGLTFPFVWSDGDKAMQRTHWAFSACRKLMAAIGQPFVPTQQLRKTVGNFMKRNVSRQAAAELLNNSERTFRETYEELHHQTAVAELVNF